MFCEQGCWRISMTRGWSDRSDIWGLCASYQWPIPYLRNMHTEMNNGLHECSTFELMSHLKGKGHSVHLGSKSKKGFKKDDLESIVIAVILNPQASLFKLPTKKLLLHDYHVSYLIISVFRLNKMHNNSHLWHNISLLKAKSMCKINPAWSPLIQVHTPSLENQHQIEILVSQDSA